MRLSSFVLLVMLLTAEVFPQISPSVSNYFRYGTGERSLGTFKGDFRYSENLTDIRVGLPYNFSAGVRILYDTPPETGLEYRGIKRRFAEYNDGDLFVRLGDFSSIYGRGLALNLFEARGLGYDTWMDGLNIRYSRGMISGGLIYGDLDFKDSIEIARNEKHRIRGGNLEITPVKNLKIGGSFIYSESNFNLVGFSKEEKVLLPSVYANYRAGKLSFIFDAAYKESENITDKSRSSGTGVFASVTYSGDGIGITLDYKNYRYDERDPFGRNDITRSTRMLPFQNPPTAIKEHSYTLLTRAIHEVDFNDETGFQVEIFYSLDENTGLNFNGSLSSRHNSFSYDESIFAFRKEERYLSFLPSADKKFFPYYEVFGEIEHYFSESNYMKAAAGYRSKVFYDEFFGGKNNHEITSLVIPLQLNNTLSNFYSYEAEIQGERVYDNFNRGQEVFYNLLFTFINTVKSSLTLTLRYELTDNNHDLSGKKNWFTIEAGYRINQGNSAVISYGSERGGQICSNGVCRYIQPFEGFRVSLLSNF